MYGKTEALNHLARFMDVYQDILAMKLPSEIREECQAAVDWGRAKMSELDDTTAPEYWADKAKFMLRNLGVTSPRWAAHAIVVLRKICAVLAYSLRQEASCRR